MTAKPAMPATGQLVLVAGPTTDVSKSFETVDELRAWAPTFTVTRVQIFDDNKPVQADAVFTYRPDGTHVSDLDDTLTICTPNGCGNPIASALEAHEWAYGQSGATVRIQPRR